MRSGRGTCATSEGSMADVPVGTHSVSSHILRRAVRKPPIIEATRPATMQGPRVAARGSVPGGRTWKNSWAMRPYRKMARTITRMSPKMLLRAQLENAIDINTPRSLGTQYEIWLNKGYAATIYFSQPHHRVTSWRDPTDERGRGTSASVSRWTPDPHRTGREWRGPSTVLRGLLASPTGSVLPSSRGSWASSDAGTWSWRRWSNASGPSVRWTEDPPGPRP